MMKTQGLGKLGLQQLKIFVNVIRIPHSSVKLDDIRQRVSSERLFGVKSREVLDHVGDTFAAIMCTVLLYQFEDEGWRWSTARESFAAFTIVNIQI